MSSRIGVDIGGTFTDLIYYDEANGSISLAKVPTTPASPDIGCLNAIAEAVPADRIGEVDYFLHGTTVGLNALLERRGAKVGLLCTRNFRDVMEIRRGARAEMYNLFWLPADPIVPRYLRRPVTERMRADGVTHQALSEADVHAALEVFRREGVDAIAISYINAYANSEHERRTAEILREAGFEGVISCSHAVSSEYREYERTSTTIVDAFVQARMADYLSRLKGSLGDAGFAGECLIMRSGGGALTFGETARRSFETIMSGPVAGAEGAAELSRAFDLGDVITADVGGTSFDTCVIRDGRPILLYEGEIAGMPLQTPWVDVRSIGSGGGSVAYVDEGGLLRVGPRSAGAVPGPACYGRGGTEPCSTDAFLHLGMLGDGRFDNGMTLDHALAEAALDTLTGKLALDRDGLACGMVRIASAFMANTVREITVEQGRDPRDMLLLAFGGAGPVLATKIADALDMKRILIPPFAGNFSAWGLLGADLVKTRARTVILPLDDDAIAGVDAALAQLFARIRAEAADDGSLEEYTPEATVDMRFAGQEHFLSVPLPVQGEVAAIDPATLRDTFLAEYQRQYGVVLEDEEVEIVACRATLRRTLPKREDRNADAGTEPNVANENYVDAYSFHLGKRVPFALRGKDEFRTGDRFAGPMIVREATTTTYVDAHYSAVIHPSGGILLTRTDQEEQAQ